MEAIARGQWGQERQNGEVLLLGSAGEERGASTIQTG